MPGDDHHARLGLGFQQALGDFETAAVRQVEVQHKQVLQVFPASRATLLDGARRGDDAQSAPQGEHSAEQLEKKPLVFHDHARQLARTRVDFIDGKHDKVSHRSRLCMNQAVPCRG
jgi:hypothetical protein